MPTNWPCARWHRPHLSGRALAATTCPTICHDAINGIAFNGNKLQLEWSECWPAAPLARAL